MMDPPVVPPDATTAPLDPAFEAKRKQIAQMLMAQRGMGQQTPIGGFANSALQAWNMMRKAPTKPMLPTTPQGPMDMGYPTDVIGGG